MKQKKYWKIKQKRRALVICEKISSDQIYMELESLTGGGRRRDKKYLKK